MFIVRGHEIVRIQNCLRDLFYLIQAPSILINGVQVLFNQKLLYKDTIKYFFLQYIYKLLSILFYHLSILFYHVPISSEL
jgi:hypothetical protein